MFFKQSYFLSLAEACLLQLPHPLSSRRAQYSLFQRIVTFLMLNCKDINLEFLTFASLKKSLLYFDLELILFPDYLEISSVHCVFPS